MKIMFQLLNACILLKIVLNVGLRVFLYDSLCYDMEYQQDSLMKEIFIFSLIMRNLNSSQILTLPTTLSLPIVPPAVSFFYGVS